jgi:cytidylate kinase
VGVVTLSRQYGAGGLRVAPVLADALGYRMVGREVVEEAARRLGIDPDVVEALDERAPAIVEEIGLALAAGTPPLGGAPTFQFSEQTSGDRALAEATRKVIESLADTGGYVVVGRGGQAALATRSDACHLSLVADIRDRARRISEWQHVDEKEATGRCHHADAERSRYVRHFYGVDIADPLLYDCVLNTSRLGVPGATQAAIAIAKQKLGLS